MCAQANSRMRCIIGYCCGPDRGHMYKVAVARMVAIFKGVHARRFVSPDVEKVYQRFGMSGPLIVMHQHD